MATSYVIYRIWAQIKAEQNLSSCVKEFSTKQCSPFYDRYSIDFPWKKTFTPWKTCLKTHSLTACNTFLEHGEWVRHEEGDKFYKKWEPRQFAEIWRQDLFDLANQMNEQTGKNNGWQYVATSTDPNGFKSWAGFTKEEINEYNNLQNLLNSIKNCSKLKNLKLTKEDNKYIYKFALPEFPFTDEELDQLTPLERFTQPHICYLDQEHAKKIMGEPNSEKPEDPYKKNYIRLSRKLYPDKNKKKDLAGLAFRNLVDSYESLKNQN